LAVNGLNSSAASLLDGVFAPLHGDWKGVAVAHEKCAGRRIDPIFMRFFFPRPGLRGRVGFDSNVSSARRNFGMLFKAHAGFHHRGDSISMR